MMIIQRLISILALLSLAACGGGGGSAGTPPFTTGGSGGTSTPAASDLVFSLSAASVANSGLETVTATATAINANRNVVAGVPVTISVDNDGIVTPLTTTTDAAGQVVATIGIGSNLNTRTITVTARSGDLVKTAALQVQNVGTAASTGASDLLLTLSATSLASSGTTPVTVTATALDAKRNVLPGVLVSLQVDSGTVAPSGTTTSASGVITGLIGTGGNPVLRTITVTATTPGLAARTVTLNVVNVPIASSPTAADLSLALSSNSLVNSGTNTITATATAVDANRNALAGIPVSISVDNNAVATVSGATTIANGTVTAAVGIGADRSNRSITVTATSGSITKSATFVVVGATLTASYSPTVVVSSANQIDYRLVDFNSAAMAYQPITISPSGQAPVTGTTDINGRFLYSYTAPAAAGSLDVVATAAGDSRTQTIAVQPPGASVPDAAAVPQSASLTPTPSVVSVNTVGSTTNQVELRALFMGANNRPVSNIRAKFIVDPANSGDGTATQLGGGVFSYSDDSGVARGVFTPGQRSSPTNGVSVLACWSTSDFAYDVSACPADHLISNTLTIASEALSVNIRTNNLVKTGVAGLTYIKEFVVMVVDAAGQAKADVLITPSVDLSAYHKGYYLWSDLDGAWVQVLTLPASTSCSNEDVNRNGVLEAGEDINGNGELDPRKSDVAIKMVSSSKTDSSGLAIVQIEYGQNLASWVDYVITVTASGVSGTEARARYNGLLFGIGNLPYPSSAVTTKAIPPAFVISPYGRAAACTNPN